jgi:predicted NBD/HSP70 family sugar kinase
LLDQGAIWAATPAEVAARNGIIIICVFDDAAVAEVYSNCDLQTVVSSRWGKPVRDMNDADVHGFGAIRGIGVEMVVALGTGCGTAIFDNGKIIPHLELAHHTFRGRRTYDQYVGHAALEEIGKKK